MEYRNSARTPNGLPLRVGKRTSGNKSAAQIAYELNVEVEPRLKVVGSRTMCQVTRSFGENAAVEFNKGAINKPRTKCVFFVPSTTHTRFRANGALCACMPGRSRRTSAQDNVPLAGSQTFGAPMHK
jgi:hypothetical protein